MLLIGYVSNNKLYLILKSGEYVCSGGVNEPENSCFVEYDKENEIVLAENVKDVGDGIYLTRNNSLYTLSDNSLIAENVRKINVWFDDPISSKRGYITINNELHRLEDNSKAKDNVKEVFKTSYYITTNNDLYRFIDNEKIGENVKKVFSYTIEVSDKTYSDIECYITNNNELFSFDGTKIAENVKEIYEGGYYLTFDNKLYNRNGTKIEDGVKYFIGGYFIKVNLNTKQLIAYYITVNNELYYYNGEQKTLVEDNVKNMFSLLNEENETIIDNYYTTNDNRIFDMSGIEYSEEQLKEIKKQYRSWYEDENGKIFYWYSGNDVNGTL